MVFLAEVGLTAVYRCFHVFISDLGKLAITRVKAREDPSVYISMNLCFLFPFYSHKQLIHTLLFVV